MMSTHPPVGVRWTLGDVSDRGFEALRLSIFGAFKLFGDAARYAVCVNSIPLRRAREQTGALPVEVDWHDATDLMPGFLRERFDRKMAEGVGWKLAPLRLFPDRHEISLDNDCILWSMPDAVKQWLAGSQPGRCLMAEDVKTCFGQFASLCSPEPRNAGLRGLPPGFDLDSALRDALNKIESELGRRVQLSSELDEQGLQTAALSLQVPPLAVILDDVTICSPFHPHRPHLGRCGAHFVGLNARHIPWRYYDRTADDCMTSHWHRHRAGLYERTGAPQPLLPDEPVALEVRCAQLS
jgi:hypothetical protein